MAMKTPGVYIVEKNAFPNSVVQVATAVPAFVGYTEKAQNGNAPLTMTPFRITSMSEYFNYFGGMHRQVFDVVDEVPDTVLPVASYRAGETARFFHPTRPSFCLFEAMRMFFLNGGGACYVVSVGGYDAERIDADALIAGLTKLKKEPEPTMVVIPEATRLPVSDEVDVAADDSGFVSGTTKEVHQAMLTHCGAEMKNRFAILDIQRGHLPQDPTDDNPVARFRNSVGTENLDYGAAYYPWLASSVFQSRDFTFADLSFGSRRVFVDDLIASLETASDEVVTDLEQMVPPETLSGTEGEEDKDTALDPDPVEFAVTAGAGFIFAEDTPVQLIDLAGVVLHDTSYESPEGRWVLEGEEDAYVIRFFPKAGFWGPTSCEVAIQKRVTTSDANDKEADQVVTEQRTFLVALPNPQIATIDKVARSICPLYSDAMDAICAQRNAMSPGGAMAGIYTTVDASRGVWKAPANVSVNAVTGPLVNINHHEQEDLNVSTTGKSINAIRPFVGEGTLVWGARTLDGNSLDWRYVNVRRTMIMIEESIRLASKAYVFEPNTAGTWVTMRSMIENFLTGVWKAGGLAGAAPEDAFNVHVGIGETMTPADVLDGIMRVTVRVAVVRPAEFIEITFQQQMQKS